MLLQIRNVLSKPSAPNNRLSLNELKNEGWTIKFGFCDSQRVGWMVKGHLQLLLVKARGIYRLKTTARAVYHVLSVQQRDQMDETSLTRWHLRFSHSNVPALQQMARQQVATGMSGELTDDFGGPCWSCQSAKMRSMSYKKTSTRRAEAPFQKLMCYMCYVGIATYDGYKHFLLVQDEASR